MFVDAPPSADDNVSITTDGRWLDSKEAVLAFLAELDAERNGTPAEIDPS